MIAKLRYSNLLALLAVAFFLGACFTPKSTLDYQTTYKGFSYEGAHARALVVTKDVAIVGGKGGYISVFFLDTARENVNNIDVVVGVEDFRDVHYNSKGACLFMNSGENGIIQGIAPSGRQMTVFDTSGVFLDGMAFWGDQVGMVYGDPVDGNFFLAKTTDMGRTWNALTPETLPKALENEAGFAASGTGIQTVGDSTVFFGTGMGKVARVFSSNDQGNNWVVKETPMRSGNSYGIYSMYFWSETEGMIIGGSYVDSTYNENICFLTADAGDSWENKSKGLPGYCSGLHGNSSASLIVATGRLGTFYTLDKGNSWNLLTNEAYYTCFVSDSHIVLSGRDGKLEFITYTVLVD